MARITVIGAGMAGLLAAGMLREECKAVFEAAHNLPNNHHAVLRFRTTAVSDALNIPFKKVKAIKAVHRWKNDIADAMAYSAKTNGTATLRSVLTADGKPQDRYIAPLDLIQRMSNVCSARIQFGCAVDDSDLHGGTFRPIISTMPMFKLMELVGWEQRSFFGWRKGFTLTADLVNVDAYCSLYVPDPSSPFSRISITGDKLMCEITQDFPEDRWGGLVKSALELLGIGEFSSARVELREQKYAKILPIDENERREFIMWCSETLGIYALGRYATWRPGLLLDDVVNDVRVIQRLINGGEDRYNHKLKG